jgi:triacylglycerol lipase
MQPFNAADALLMARCSQRTYDGAFAEEVPGIELVEGNPHLQACLFLADGEYVLAFRGSTDLSDWLTDVECDLVEWPTYAGRVHRGFATRLDNLWRWCDSAVKYHCGAGAIRVTGHSLGGALATLAALRFDDQLAGPVYTFGTPRVGDKAFAADYGPTHYRIINELDIVTHSPPAWRYRHVGTPVLIEDDAHGTPSAIVGSTWLHWLLGVAGRFQSKGVFATAGEELTDHGIEHYVAKLEQLAGGEDSRRQAA